MIAMPFISVRDIQIYYEIHGKGPPLLSISGTGGDLRSSPSIFETPLAQHFKILAYDQRGLGQTSHPDIPYSMADYADDADGLLKVVGWNRCLVIGVSFGGMVSQEFALRYPHRVERLVLACTSSGGVGGASYPLHELAHLKRWDLPLGCLVSLLQVLHWFNPILWYGFRRMRADREQACDAMALNRSRPGQLRLACNSRRSRKARRYQ